MSKKIRNFIMTFAIVILGLVILPNDVKAYAFSGYDVHSKAYILAQNSEGVYEDYTCTFDTDYCTINITDEIYPLSRIVGKLYKNSFQFTSGKNYKFTIFIKANFDISAYKNDLVFRLCANDYSCNILELLDSSIEKVDVDIYKFSFIFNSILTTPQVVSFWFDNVSDVPIGSYYGVYKYHKLESYTPPVEPEEPEEPDEPDEPVSSLPYIDLNYSSVKTKFDTYFYDMEKIINYLNQNYNDNYDYVIKSRINSTEALTYIEISKKGTARTFLTTLSNTSKGLYDMYIAKTGNTYEENRYVHCVVNANNFTSSKKNIDTCISQLSTTTLNSPQYELYNSFVLTGSNYKLNYIGNSSSDLLVYSNNKVYNKQVYNGSVQAQKYNFYLEGNIYQLNDEIPTYWEWSRLEKFYLRETYDASIYELESLNFNFNLQDLYNNSIGKDFKIKIEVTNPEEVETIIENTSYGVFYKEKNTGFYEKTDFEYFPLEYEYVENEHSLYLIFKNNLNKELYYYDGVRFSVNFKNSYKNILNIYANVEYGEFELFSSETENFPGYQKVLISSNYKDYVISANESKSFSIIANRDNILNLTEGDLIVFKYDFSTPIYSSDTFEILNEGITLSPYPWGSYNGTYNDYVEFYVTLDYLNNKVVLIRNNHDKDFYIWIPYDVNISPVKTDGSFELVTPDNGIVDGNASSNNKDYTNLPTIGDENFFSYIKKGISSFTGNISYIFQSVANIFNGFNEGIQTFFITIFFISLALFVIRFLF